MDVRQIARSQLVGRRRELETLQATLESVVEGREPQLVTIVGVPGSASRGSSTSSSGVEAQKARHLAPGRSLPYGDGVGFWALGEMVKARTGILETDGPQQTEEKLRRMVTELAAGTTRAGSSATCARS